MGLKPCNIYFQSEDHETQKLGYIFSNETNMSELRAIYGFDDSSPILHVNSPIVQASDVLHSQLKIYGGPRPTIVPVGVDQDPHIRLMRDIAQRLRIYNVKIENNGISVYVKGKEDPHLYIDSAIETLNKNNYKTDKNYEYRSIKIINARPEDKIKIDLMLIENEKPYNDYAFIAPSATFQKLETGLKGGKMSSSVPDSLISLNDTEGDATRKIKNAVTGGQKTIEEQKKYGGNPDMCPVYELYSYHNNDENYVQSVYDECKGGARMCGLCKKEAGENISQFLKNMREKRDESLSKINDYLMNKSP